MRGAISFELRQPDSDAPPGRRLALSYVRWATRRVPHCVFTVCAADAWSKFDEDAAVMALENEGKSADEPGWTMRATPGVAAVQATDYVKDKEEVALDRDLATKRSELQAPRG